MSVTKDFGKGPNWGPGPWISVKGEIEDEGLRTGQDTAYHLRIKNLVPTRWGVGPGSPAVRRGWS